MQRNLDGSLLKKYPQEY